MFCAQRSPGNARKNCWPARSSASSFNKVSSSCVNYKLDCTRESIDLHLPYWLAFYGEDAARCRVMDAVRRRIEGAKASAFFEEWLAA